jgi:hypothetical protein
MITSSTLSLKKYSFKKGITVSDGIVVKPEAIIFSSSVTAIPDHFNP